MAINALGFIPLQTKLSPPIQSINHLLIRDRLNQPNFQWLLHKVVTIIAPAGYGKSMLMLQWYQQAQSNLACGWLSLDEQDNDPLRLMRYIIFACQQGLKKPLQVIELASQLGGDIPPDYLVDALLTEIEQLEEPILLFIDDIHLLRQKETLQLFNRLIYHAPPYISFILAGRSKSRIILGKLNLAGRLQEYDVKELQFNLKETSQFFTQKQIKQLSRKHYQQIQTKSEGWAAGLQLIAIALQSHSLEQVLKYLHGSSGHITDYLEETVLTQQPQALQSFLLKTSVLERFNVELCHAVTSQKDSASLLETVKKEQLFLIPLNEEDEWYRYHHLFQEHLQKRFKKIDHNGYKACLTRASLWCEQQNLISEAINYAFKAKDYNQAGSLLENHGFLFVQVQPQFQNYIKWARQLPNSYLSKHIAIRVFSALALIHTQDYEGPKNELLAVDQWLNSNKKNISIEQYNNFAHSLIDSFYGNFEKSEKIAKQSITKYPNLPDFFIGGINFALSITSIFIFKYQQARDAAKQSLEIATRMESDTGVTWSFITFIWSAYYQGQIDSSYKLIKNGLEKLNQIKKHATFCQKMFSVMKAEVTLEQGHIEYAKRAIREAGNIFKHVLFDPYVCTGYKIIARILWFNGQYQLAQDLIADGIKMTKKQKLPYLRCTLTEEQIRQLIANGSVLEAKKQVPELFKKLDEIITGSPRTKELIMETKNLITIRMELAQDNYQTALKLIAPLIIQFKRQGRINQYMRLAIIKAYALHLASKDNQAMSMLESLLKQAIPNGMLMVFVEEGFAIKPLILKVLEYIGKSNKELAQSNNYERLVKLLTTDKGSVKGDFYDVLTQREQSILQQLDSTLKLDDIAKQLFITTYTLKWHLKNIYRKLQVSNRSGAVKKASKYDLISKV